MRSPVRALTRKRVCRSLAPVLVAAGLAVAVAPPNAGAGFPSLYSPPSAKVAGSAGYEKGAAGYAVSGSNGEFTSASAMFDVPTVTCAPTENSIGVFWMGIDGYGTSTVEQDGVEVGCSNGSPQYSAWYEIYPAYDIEAFSSPPTIQAGDVVTMQVTYEGSSTYKFVVDDVTDSQSATATQANPSSAPPVTNSTAECIAEDPADGSGNPVPYPTFSPASFTSCTADGESLGTYGPDSLTMTSDGGPPGVAPDYSVVDASPGTLGTTSAAFTVTRIPAIPNQTVLATGLDGATWEKFWQGSASTTDWSYWDSARGGPSGVSLFDIAVGFNQFGNLNLFATGSDGNLWQNWWTGSGWSGWSSLGNGGAAFIEVAIGRNQYNNPNLFATGVDNQVWQDWWTGSGWSGWHAMGNGGVALNGGLADGPNQLGNPNLFAGGADGQVWQDFWTGSRWSGWRTMGNGGVALTGGVADGRNQFNNPNLFATGTDGQVWQDVWTGSRWSGWRPMGDGGVGLDQITVQRNIFGRNNLFATGADGQVWQAFWTGSSWFGWVPLGTGLQTTPLLNGIATPQPWGT